MERTALSLYIEDIELLSCTVDRAAREPTVHKSFWAGRCGDGRYFKLYLERDMGHIYITVYSVTRSSYEARTEELPPEMRKSLLEFVKDLLELAGW